VYEVRVDTNKNRLYLILKGFLKDGQAKEAADQVIAGIDKLKPGFDIITDIREFKPMSPKGSDEIARGQQYAKDKGVRRIVRVVGREVIGGMQFDRVAQNTEVGGEYTESIENAEALLDEEDN
jgi:hypothetical protein